MFDVQCMGGYPELGVGNLLRMTVGVLRTSSVVLWLPRTTNLQQLGIEVAKLGGHVRCHIELAKINGVDKAITTYIGAEQQWLSSTTQLQAAGAGSNYTQRNAAHLRQNIACLVGKTSCTARVFVLFLIAQGFETVL